MLLLVSAGAIVIGMAAPTPNLAKLTTSISELRQLARGGCISRVRGHQYRQRKRDVQCHFRLLRLGILYKARYDGGMRLRESHGHDRNT